MGHSPSQFVIYSVTNCADFLTFTEVGCDDDNGVGLLPETVLEGLMVGNEYYIQVDGYNGRQGTFDIGVLTDTGADISSIKEVKYGLTVNVYPNPISSELVTVNSNQEMEEIKIYNLSQQIVFSEVVNKQKASIDVSDLTPGAYIIAVRSNGFTYTERLIKQ